MENLDDVLQAAKAGREQKIRAARPAENRKHFRHPIHWRIAIIHKNGDKNDIYHGQTHDLSLGGASVLIDHNIFMNSEVLMLLAIPPSLPGQKEIIIEAQCRMAHTVFDSGKGRFRIGIRFQSFKGEGKQILSRILSKRVIHEPDQKPYG